MLAPLHLFIPSLSFNAVTLSPFNAVTFYRFYVLTLRRWTLRRWDAGTLGWDAGTL